MLNLITAVPGSGKTLFLLKTVSEVAKKDDRQVYYSGIPLTDQGKEVLGWIELDDPEKWHELPAGAIIVIDECQRVFPPRRTGTNIPKHVSMFETHRHHGFDVWLITQAPRLMDSHIRQLVNKHYHLKRMFGGKIAALLSWDCCEELPNTTGASARCIDKKKFHYPREVFGWYKSAELHTHKLQLPRKLLLTLALLVIAPIAVYTSVAYVRDLGKPVEKKSVQVGQVSQSRDASAPASSAVQAKPMTPVEFQQTTIPLDPARPETAPRYDHLNTPTAMPAVSGCIKSATKCTCYTDQATVIKVPLNRCEEIIADGHFNEYRQPQQNQPPQLADAGQLQERQPQPRQADPDAGIYSFTVPDTRQKTPNMM